MSRNGLIDFDLLTEDEKKKMNGMLDKLDLIYKERDLLFAKYKSLSEDIELLQAMIMRFSNKIYDEYLMNGGKRKI